MIEFIYNYSDIAQACFHAVGITPSLGVSVWGKAYNLSELCSHRMQYNKSNNLFW